MNDSKSQYVSEHLCSTSTQIQNYLLFWLVARMVIAPRAPVSGISRDEHGAGGLIYDP